ncbi:MAG: hypothetical protein ACR9NN_13610 [Nostochopsis sp.]
MSHRIGDWVNKGEVGFSWLSSLGLDDLETTALTRRQLYVAMTRAQQELYLFGSRNVRLIDELYSTGCFEVRASGTEKQA